MPCILLLCILSLQLRTINDERHKFSVHGRSDHIQASQMEHQFNNFLAHTDLQLIGGSLCADDNLSQLTDGSAKAMMMMLLQSRFTQTSPSFTS